MTLGFQEGKGALASCDLTPSQSASAVTYRGSPRYISVYNTIITTYASPIEMTCFIIQTFKFVFRKKIFVIVLYLANQK